MISRDRVKALLGRSKGRFLKLEDQLTEKVPYEESVGHARDIFVKFKKGAVTQRQSIATQGVLSPTTYSVQQSQEMQGDAASSLSGLFQKLDLNNNTRQSSNTFNNNRYGSGPVMGQRMERKRVPK